MTSKAILATGGAGFIGSHVAAELLDAGFSVTILDNLENAQRDVVDRLETLGLGTPQFVEGDVRDGALLERLFTRENFAAVVHLAGKKAVGESVANPLLYYDENLNGALALLRTMQAHNVRNLVFSSSATVYGLPEQMPIKETAPTGAVNPYGQTKLMIEQFIDGVTAANPDFSAISLRYFNPVGAHASGLIGENPLDVPNNLFPFIAQAAAGLRKPVQVFGADYDTPDGTGVRDYIHVVDLAKGHVAALDYLMQGKSNGNHTRFNLGRGQGYSVLEAIAAFSKACGSDIPHEIVARRPGDIACSIADPSAAHAALGWEAELDLEAMCRDHWAFQHRLLKTQA